MNKEELKKFKGKMIDFLNYVLRYLELRNYNDDAVIGQLKGAIEREIKNERKPMGTHIPIEIIDKIFRG